MEISYELQLSDLETANTHLRARLRENAKPVWRRIGAGLIVGFVISLLFPSAGKNFGGFYHQWAWLVTAVIFFGSLLWLRFWRRTRRATRWLEQFTGNFSLTLTPAGLSTTAPGARVGFRAWPEILAFEMTDAYLYLYLRSDIAITVPRAALGDNVEAFADRVRTLWAAHPYNAGKTLPLVPQWHGSGRLGALWTNIRGGARIAFLRDFSNYRFEVSGYHYVRLLLVSVICFGTVEYTNALPSPTFNIYGLTTIGTLLLLLLAAVASISGMQAQRGTMLRLLIMVTAAALVIKLVYLPVYLVIGQMHLDSRSLYWVVYIIYELWVLLVVFRIMVHLYRQPAPGALSYVGVFAFFTLALGSLLPNQQLYYNGERSKELAASFKAREKLNVEDAFYSQPVLVRRAVARLAPQRPGMTDLYFVGFAGDGNEKVFSNEVRFARHLLDRRFGTRGRSLVLVNSPEATDNTLLADPHNLDAVLKGIAARMNRKEDVLFLFLSSHGAQDHRLAVSEWPLQLNDLKAEQLKAMLDRYGIKNRVIVVSACYSGGFLDVLKDDNTLVLTASSRDHVAYGCGDYTRYTYFGKSYFVKALAHGNSFITSFGKARHMIEEREKQEGQDPSRPQIYVGHNIQAILKRLRVSPVSTAVAHKGLQTNLSG